MTSSAISAQGSVLSIGTGSGGAKTITGVAVGFPTIFTSAAHGFSNGDYVAFAALTGANAATFNGLSFTVRDKTTNTFAIDVDSTVLTITAGSGTATATTWTVVNNIHDFTGFDGQASELDRTNLSSLAKEFALGLVDPGQFSMNVDIDLNDVGQAALRAKQQSGVITNFKLQLTANPITGETFTFTGFVKKFSLTGGVDALAKSAIDIRISGTVTAA